MSNDSKAPEAAVEAAAQALWQVQPLTRENVRAAARRALEAAAPHTIMERFEDNGPDELPPQSVVLSAGKPAIMQHDGTFMDYDGCSWDTWEMTYPLTVIHEPEAEATR